MDRRKLIAGLLCVLVLGGCSSIGNAPSGESNEDLKARMDKLPLDEHAKEIKKLSLPNELKKKAIEDLYAKAGKTAPPEVLADLGGGGASGAPAQASGGNPSGAPDAAAGK